METAGNRGYCRQRAPGRLPAEDGGKRMGQGTLLRPDAEGGKAVEIYPDPPLYDRFIHVDRHRLSGRMLLAG